MCKKVIKLYPNISIAKHRFLVVHVTIKNLKRDVNFVEFLDTGSSSRKGKGSVLDLEEPGIPGP